MGFSKHHSKLRLSLVAQMVKNPPAMRKTWVRPLGWEVPLEKEMATDSSFLAWRIPWTAELVSHSPWDHKEWVATEHTHPKVSVGEAVWGTLRLDRELCILTVLGISMRREWQNEINHKVGKETENSQCQNCESWILSS